MTWFTSKSYKEKIKWCKRFYDPDYIVEREKLLGVQLSEFCAEQWYYQPKDTEIKLKSKNVLNEQIERPDYCPRHYNSQLGLIQLAILAQEKKAHLVYVEQDCLVFGLKYAILSSLDSRIRFGGKEWAYKKGWAEQSFIFVHNGYLDEFINKIFKERLWFNSSPEPRFENMFKSDCDYWSFGFGRARPIEFDTIVGYAQQLNDTEFNQFKKRIEGKQYDNQMS